MSEKKDDLITLQFKPWQFLLIFSTLTFLLGMLFGYFIWGNDKTAPVEVSQIEDNPVIESTETSPLPNTPEPTTGPPATVDPDGIARYAVPEDDDPSLGPEDALITIIEFSDYQCPWCAKYHNETFNLLLENYGDVVRFVYRDFPLGMHPEAFPAAEAANCAGDQDKYWDFHHLLFTSDQDALGRDLYLKYAEDLELDLDRFQECVDSRVHRQEVQADYASARKWGVKSSPTFFINGAKYPGFRTFESFASIIEAELARLDQ
jgi:protein-disulfide isomerase